MGRQTSKNRLTLESATIFAHDGDGFWDQRLQVVLFEAGEDFDVQTTAYRFFRHVTFNTALNPAGAYFQIGEIEYFGDANVTAVDPKAKLTTTWGKIKTPDSVKRRSYKLSLYSLNTPKWD